MSFFLRLISTIYYDVQRSYIFIIRNTYKTLEKGGTSKVFIQLKVQQNCFD
jgi:hypothetical protein